ncbi:MAG: hypothetical protein ISS71_01600 [Phycisphaerae bacterium]|nr:hypothetical protein [Phycisphaerae bacterium]
MAQENNRHNELSVVPEVDAFIRGLNDQYRMLVILKSQLYGGRWEPMLEDLQNRLEGKPYIFKLANRIKDDVDRIQEMQTFETEHDIDLADFVKLES